ncbi:hypothetical protein SISSUDRAFT_629609 [Sistotremastrum suecicum HHB10207 ss-3]|uniref:G-protein coupled receptors family 1 profile domain-containing protein n=1 Tax=Sistotremastrum suecicum HHB10207 ss-3 TaxID=1314776 RepID=A0A166EGK1_9AGAM|nr:hypothetical protein SISSUDRAFT_629609 [Sistotremastrum suecicum HHB10207 ss-3]
MQSPSHQTRRHMITAKTLRTGPRPVRGIYGPIAPLKICLAMLLTAQIGITFLIATIALTKIRRAPAFHNFMFIIWIGTFTYLLLFYTGQYEADIPRPEVCAAQAIMKHGADSAAVSALFLLSVESWRLAIREKANSKSSRSWLILTLAIPYAHFVAFATITAIFVNANPQNAYRTLNSFYCTLRNVPFGIIQGVELNALVLFAVIFQVKTGLLYWKRRKVAHQCRELRIKVLDPESCEICHVYHCSLYPVRRVSGVLDTERRHLHMVLLEGHETTAQ